MLNNLSRISFIKNVDTLITKKMQFRLIVECAIDVQTTSNSLKYVKTGATYISINAMVMSM